MSASARTRVLYLAPWVDYGGSDKGTIDWFRWIDRSRYSVMLATTQPSMNRRLAEICPYADEVWPLPDLMAGQHMPTFIFDLIAMRGIEVLHIMNSRIGYELLADLSALAATRRRSSCSSTSRSRTARATSASSPAATATSSTRSP